MPRMRLQKFLSQAGLCSRRQGEIWIRAGRVQVNGKVSDTLGARIDPAIDRVEVDGRRVRLPQKHVYIALHKPRDYVTSCRHPGERVVTELVDLPRRIYPVGRLDKDSTGLLLLTDDGRLHNRLTHPSYDHEKEYEVRLTRPLPDGALEKLARGLPLMGRRTRPARVQRISRRCFRIIMQEGRNRQIRRMVRKVGGSVASLKRIRVANIRLGDLPEGAWRMLEKSERRQLLQPAEARRRQTDRSMGGASGD